ncbi:MAG TPA: hypothetical protein VFF63_09320, partial [Candidatus Babeliales bacterium]|nr:hypothetical protein [Candidatus Babeliales bacterium]
MGKIRLYFAASLDGYIADPEGGVGFLEAFQDEDSGYDAFFSDIGTLVMGRGTYKFVEDYGSWPYRQMRTIVLTHRAIVHRLCELQTRAVDDFASFARELREFSDGDAWIVGGGKVMGAFLAAGGSRQDRDVDRPHRHREGNPNVCRFANDLTALQSPATDAVAKRSSSLSVRTALKRRSRHARSC